jgi:hypothetical protein
LTIRWAPLAVGGGVAVALGVFGWLHEPGVVAGSSGLPAVKLWLAGGAALLAVVQLLSALGRRRLPWAAPVHRWSGRVAFLLTVPVAVHCLYALGFAAYNPRVLAHSLLGCFFYGAFTAKMLFVSRTDLAWWVLPAAGGSVFTALLALWLTAVPP